MSTYIGPLTNSLIDYIIKEVNKKETKERIMTSVIDPFLSDLSIRYYPYFIMMIIILLLIVILLVALLVLAVINK